MAEAENKVRRMWASNGEVGALSGRWSRYVSYMCFTFGVSKGKCFIRKVRKYFRSTSYISKFDVILVDLKPEFHNEVLSVVKGIRRLKVGDVAIIIRSTGSP